MVIKNTLSLATNFIYTRFRLGKGGKVDKKKMLTPEQFDNLTTIWVLSSNDVNPIMTYKGIIYRLDLDEKYDVKGLVNHHQELFRLKVPPRHLENWKKEMRVDETKRPSYMRCENEQRQREMIEEITVDDVFRSQFRLVENAARTSIEIIDWGLQHLDRQRKAGLEYQQTIATKAQVFWAIGIAVLSLAFQIISALFIKP